MKALFVIVYIAFLDLSWAERLRFDNHTVFRITPKSEDALNFFKDLEYNGDQDYNFWSPVKSSNHPIDIMVAPDKKSYIEELIKSKGMASEVLMQNVQDHIDNEGVRPESKAGTFGWTNYHTLDEVSIVILLY